MTNSQKIALTLLITVVICSVFTIIAFSNLFDLVESNFYSLFIQKEVENDINFFKEKIEEYNNINLARYRATLNYDYIEAAFLTNQSREVILNRRYAFEKLQKSYPRLEFVRFIGQDGKKIHFSTLDEDILRSEEYEIYYNDLDKVEERFSGSELLSTEDYGPKVILDGEREKIIYSFPIVDSTGRYRGSVLFYVLLEDLANYLINYPELGFRKLICIDLSGIIIDTEGLFLNISKQKFDVLKNTIRTTWQPFNLINIQSQYFEIGEEQEGFRLLYTDLEGFGKIGMLIRGSSLEMPIEAKITILVAISLTIFLIIFLIFNIRQDPFAVVTHKVKKFQVQILEEFLEREEKADIDNLKRELAVRKSEVKDYIKKGVKNIPAKTQPKIDALIDKSWEEIFTVIGRKFQEPSYKGMDISRIEQIIKSALASKQIVIPTSKKVVTRKMLITEQVEKIEPDEVVKSMERVEEVGEEKKIPQLEQVEDIEEVKAVENIEEAEAVEEVEVLDEVEEAEAIEEAEAVEEAEAIEEVEDIEEVEALEEVESIEPIEQAVTAENIEEVEELEQIEEVEAVEEKVEKAAVESEQEKEVEEVVVLSQGKVIEEQGSIEELESIKKIKPLPPEPYEELEELSIAESETKKKSEAQIKKEQKYNNFLKLIEQKKIMIYSIEDIKSFVEKANEKIELKNGIYTIKEEVFESKKTSRNLGLRELAQAVLNKTKANEEKHESGIDQIISRKGSLTLLYEDDSADIPFEQISKRVAVKKRLILEESGLNLDKYLDDLGPMEMDKKKINLLGDFSKRVKAVGVAIIGKTENKYKIVFSVGFDEKSNERFEFEENEHFCQNYLLTRKVISINLPITEIKLFSFRLYDEFSKFIYSSLLFPVIYDKKPGYLVFAFPQKVKLDLENIIKQLNICIA